MQRPKPHRRLTGLPGNPPDTHDYQYHSSVLLVSHGVGNESPQKSRKRIITLDRTEVKCTQDTIQGREKAL
jgi:hypothetical protein